MIEISKLPPVHKGIFIDRPNRFLAKVKIDSSQVEQVHVHDPGRLKELLYSRNSETVNQG